MRLAAWILIQALVLSQIPLPFANAQPDQLRGQAADQSTTQAGLEETLTAPTLVSRVTKTGIQVARRGGGVPVGEGIWSIQQESVKPQAIILPPDPGKKILYSAKYLLRPGLAVLQAHAQDAAVQIPLGQLQVKGVRSIPILFLEDHASLLDWRPGEEPIGQVQVDVTVSPKLYDPQYGEGLGVLGALLLHHAATRVAGYNQRQAYHFTVAFYESLSEKEQAALHQALDTRWIDHGNTLLTFLKRTADLEDSYVRRKDSLTLEAQLKTETDPDRRDLITYTIHHRDRLVSWLLGQVQIDFPIDREQFEQAVTKPGLTLEQRREEAYRVVRAYDQKVERANAQRVATHFRESMPDGFPPPTVVAGRLSRAFDNQAMLFSTSAWVPRTKEIVEAVEVLDKVTEGKLLLEEMDRAVAADHFRQRELKILRDRIGAVLLQLQPAMGRLRLLALGPDPVASMTQYRGAIRQLREVLAIFRTRAGGAIQAEWQTALDAAQEGIARKADDQTVRQLKERMGRFETTLGALVGEKGRAEEAIKALEGALAKAETIAAAFAIQLQRPSRTGSINLYDVNELTPKPEQEASLQKLVRLGGHNTYGSPDYEWVAQATDVIEAAPLSIYERLIEVDGKYVTIFEVDQEGLEQTIRQMADYWARNIEGTIDSEHVALAREIVVFGHKELRSQADLLQQQEKLSPEDAYRRVIRDAEGKVQDQVALVAAWLADQIDRRIEEVESFIERHWQEKDFVDRFQALKAVMVGDDLSPEAKARKCQSCLGQAARRSKELKEETERLKFLVAQRRREMPAFHLLTTEAPGLVEGFVQVVLEEEMALRNLIRGEGRRLGVNLERKVAARMKFYQRRLSAVAEKVVQEFGYGVIADNYVRQGMSRPQALQQVLEDNITLREEAVRIAVLAEAQEAQVKRYRFRPDQPDHPLVEALLKGPPTLPFEVEARSQVWERNKLDASFQERVRQLQESGLPHAEAIARAIDESEVFRQELKNTMRRLARAEALRQLEAQHPDWKLDQRARSWYRDHTALAKTTGRREVIYAHQLNAKMMDPRYYYGSGAAFQRADGKFQPTGRRKRYHLIYAPSRVNLGRGERVSVEVLPQWVGVTDPLAARRAKRVYELINYNVVVRTIKEAENFKVSENERTALLRAIANTQAFYTQSLGFGDTEDLSYQFNLRGGLPVATIKEGETFQAGPTTGYCIPKDPLFKLFRTALKDPLKLIQIGIPAHLHPAFFQMVVELEAHRSEFDSEGAFENWMIEELLSEESLRMRFHPSDADRVRQGLSQYIGVTGGVPIFHLVKLHELLGNLGIPSLLATHGQDLGLILWSNWAGEKVTLGGEQVNRATLFQITRDIFSLREEAARLNSGVPIAEEKDLLVQMYGPYKGDPDHPSPPDVRDNAAGRVFMDLSDMGHLVAHALDEKGQLIWRANRYGFRPDSDHPEDLRVTRLLAEEYLGITETQVLQDRWVRIAWAFLRKEVDDPVEFRRQEAQLLDQGFAQIVRRLQAEPDPRIAVLDKEFPGHGTVGSITVTVVPGVSTEDFLGFKVDAKTALVEVADQVQELLQSYGVRVDQMWANAQDRRPLDQWVPLTDLPPDQMERLRAQVGGRFHPLAFRLRGPGTNFQEDLQQQDVAVFITVHPELLAMAPSQIRDRMLTGRPFSALAIRDGSVQGRHRVWFDRDIMLWFAAGRGKDKNGETILDWSKRDTEGRKAVYTAFGLGEHTWKPLLGTDLREEVVRQEHRAMRLYEVLSRVAQAREGELKGAVEAARKVFAQELSQDQMVLEAGLAGEYQQMLQAKGMDKPRDEIIRNALEKLARGLPLEKFNRIHWLAIGGMYLLHGVPQNQQDQVMAVLERAEEPLRQAAAGLEAGPPKSFPLLADQGSPHRFDSFWTNQNESVGAAGRPGAPQERGGGRTTQQIQQLLVPEMPITAMQQLERKGEMFSVKASEKQAARAVARLTALQAEAARQAALALREEGFRRALKNPVKDEYGVAQKRFRELTEAVREDGSPEDMHRRMGEIVGRSLNAMRKLNNELLAGDSKERDKLEKHIQALTGGRELNMRQVRAFVGTYENPVGVIARWFELAGPSGREKVARVAELFTTTLALEKTASFLGQAAQKLEEAALWRGVSEFFAETIDDHFYEYNPWVYDPKRGSGFSDFYDPLGALRPERAEELYQLAWDHHRLLYDYLRLLVVTKTSFRELPASEQDLLLGRVKLGVSSSEDRLLVQGIGARAPTAIERKWRAYNQLREFAFLRNDGFHLPVLFQDLDPNDPEILDASRRVNITLMTPVGRTHNARTPMEASALGENLFATRDGFLVTPPGAKGPVLQIREAHFWMSQEQYRKALKKYRGMSDSDMEAEIALDKAMGRLTPKGIRVAARFTQPVNVGALYAFHHHHLSRKLTEAGYAYTDKSDVHFEITYDKALYPDAFNPAYRTGVLLPPEIDWLRQETTAAGDKESAIERIQERVRPFAQEHRIIVAKGSAESGSRNFQRFDPVGSDGNLDEEEFFKAAEFIYEVSKGQNVTTQKAIIVTPLAWMDPKAVEEFVDRQIRDFGVAVNLERHPKSWVYGTLRVILSAGMPTDLKETEQGLYNPSNWHVAHWITLNSLQVATNVGRQGTLEKLISEMVRPEFRETFLAELEQAGRRVMVAMTRYGKRYWDEVYVPGYRQRYGEDPPEFDATGVPYWWPRYLMLDFLPEPIWGRNGQEVPGAKVKDIVPGDPARGTSPRFTLQAPNGEEFEAQILGFKLWLLEPNTGIGLWDRYWLREKSLEEKQAKQENRPMDWLRIGEGDRVVLEDYLAAGEAFLKAKFGDSYFGPERRPARRPSGPQLDFGAPPGAGPPVPTEPPTPPPPATPFEAGLTSLRGKGIQTVGPAQVSLLLVEAALTSSGGRQALAEQDPEQVVLAQADRWLSQPQRIEEFPQGVGISVSRDQVREWLGDSTYRRRVAELVLDQVLSEPLAPPVEILPAALSPQEVSALLSHRKTFAVVTGKRALMNHHLYPWAVGQGRALVNVIGVNQGWLTPDGRAQRFMIFNPQTGRFLECACARPVRFTHAFVTELPRENETERHEQLGELFQEAGVHLINPAVRSLVRADDKDWLRRHAPSEVPTPQSVVIDPRIPVRGLPKVLREFSSQSPSGIVIQPKKGTTEGEGVEWLASRDGAGQVKHLKALRSKGDVLVSAYRGNVTYQGRSVVLRFNVAAGAVASASAVVAPEGSKIASLGRQGNPERLQTVLRNLQDPHGQPIQMTQETWERLERTAQAAAHLVDLGIVGIDMVLEGEGQEIRGVVLEANARPGTLIFGERVEFPENLPVESYSASPATPGFWNSLPAPMAPIYDRARETRLDQVLFVGTDPNKHQLFRQAVERRYPWVNLVSIRSFPEAMEYAHRISRGEEPIPRMVFQADIDELDAAFFTEMNATFSESSVLGILGDTTFQSLDRLEGVIADHGLEIVGVWEAFTLNQWQRIAADPERSGLRAVVARTFRARWVDAELARVRKLVETAVQREVQLERKPKERLFDPKAKLALGFAPGRIRFRGGHMDIRGNGGQNVNGATHYGIWVLTQVAEDPEGRVILDNMDPSYKPYEFNLGDPNVTPPDGIAKIDPHWIQWAQAHTIRDKWQGLSRALMALIRTDHLDPKQPLSPEGPRRRFLKGKGVRFLVSKSTLPMGKGLASSSTLPAVLIRGLQPFFPPEARLNDQQLNELDYVAYMVGDQAGTADMTAINTSKLGEISVLWSFPERVGESVKLPSDLKYFIVDSKVMRLDDPRQPDHVQNYAAFIKSMTGRGYAMASLWLRHLARTDPEVPQQVEEILMTHPAGHPFGLLRELTEAGAITDPRYTSVVGGDSLQARRAFVERFLRKIPNDLKLGEILGEIQEDDLRKALNDLLVGFTPLGAHKAKDAPDPEEFRQRLKMETVIPMGQMGTYAIREIGWGLDYVEAASAGDSRKMVQSERKAHDGDRAVWKLNEDGTLSLTPWGQSNPEAAFFRSVPEMDEIVDAFRAHMAALFGEEDVAELRVLAAGLGGAFGLHLRGTEKASVEQVAQAAQQWLEGEGRGMEVIEVEPGGGATTIGDLTLPPAAGLEEWKELEFHLKRIESAEAAPESKTQAVGAILNMGLKDGKILPRQIPKLVEHLIPPYRSEPDPGVKAALLELLAYAGFDHPEVSSLFSERLKEPANDPVLSRGIFGLTLKLLDGPDSPSVKSHRMNWLSMLLPILSRGISIEAKEFLGFLVDALESAQPGSPEDSAMRKELSRPEWLDPLRALYEKSQATESIHRPAGMILWELGQPVEPEHREMFEALSKEELSRAWEIHLSQKQKIPLTHRLSPEQIDRLKDQVAQHGRLPAVFLEELFSEEKRQIVFINRQSAGEDAFEEGKGILADLRYLAGLRVAPILLALPLPYGMEGDLESFLKDGRPSAGLWNSFAGLRLLFFREEITDAEDRELVEENIRSWRILRTLPGDVRLALYGAEPGISGENRFDSVVFNLKKILKENQGAWVVVYAGEPSPDFPEPLFSKKNLTGEDQSAFRSLALALAQEWMPGKIASVIEQTEARWEWDEEDKRLHNLVELARAVPSSFGIRLNEIDLQAIRFDQNWLETYHPEVWDGLILRREDDRRDPEFFLPPKLPRPQVLEPPSPAPVDAVPLVSAAGLEEVEEAAEQALQRAARELGINLNYQWRGVGPDGYFSTDELMILTAEWSPPEVVDSAKAVEFLRKRLTTDLGIPPVRLYTGSHYFSISIPEKQASILRDLNEEFSPESKKVALIIGDNLSLDLLNSEQAQTLPMKVLIQVLLQGEGSIVLDGYPHVVTAPPRTEGFDTLLGQLLQAIQGGQRYGDVALLSSEIPSEWRGRVIDPRELVMVNDVDNTVLTDLDTFDKTQGEVDGQIFQKDRRDRIVELARFGVDFRFITGKAAQEISGRRVRSDEDRLLLPLNRSLGLDTNRIGYDGISGRQRGRYDPTGQLTWSRVLPDGEFTAFSKDQVLQVFQFMFEAVRAAKTAGLEEGGVVEMIFNRMPPRSAGQDLGSWLDQARQSPQPGMASPVRSTAQFISSLIEGGGRYSFEQRRESWSRVTEDLIPHLSDPFQVAWATAVFTLLSEMVTGSPGEEPSRKALQRFHLAQLELYLRREVVVGGKSRRSRLLTGEGDTYDAFVRDYFPKPLLPGLDPEGGLSALLHRLEEESERTGRRWKWLVGAGGTGGAAQEAVRLYRNLGPVVVDVVDWKEADLDPDEVRWIKEEAPRRGVPYEHLWTKQGLDFRREDLSRFILESSSEAPLRLITVLTTLSFMPDPLGTLVHLYNQLPEGKEGYLLANLAIPTTSEQAEELVRFYETVVFPTLQRLGVEVHWKVTDVRKEDAPAQKRKAGSQELQLGFILIKKPESPAALRLNLTPHAEPVLTHRPDRDVEYQLALYEGDYAQPITQATAGLEESLEQVTVEGPGLAVEFRPSTVRRNLVHIFDPEMAEMGLLVARIQTDPAVIIAEDFDQAGWLMDEGFTGGDRRILLQGNRTIEEARDKAAALFGEFTPRLYPAEGRDQSNLWIAWVLEQYDVSGLTVQQAVEMIEEFTRRQAA